MKKIYKVSLFVFLLATMLFQQSCTDENKFNNPVTFALESGGFAAFSVAVPDAAYPDPATIAYSGDIVDTNNNLSSYSVRLIATISGNDIVVENFFSTTTFPATFSFTTQSLADAVGIPTTDINFGDNFNFIATAVRNDGTEFLGIPPAFDDSTLTVSGGNTEPQLQTPGYNSAMQFSFIVSCPFDRAAMLGTYTVVSDDGFSAAGGGPGFTFQVIAGAADNEIVLVNPLASAGNFNLTLTVSPFGLATFDAQEVVLTPEICSSAPVCTQGTPTTFRSNASTSLSLSCIGFIDLRFSTRFSQGGGNWSFGDGVFVAQRN